MSQFDVVGKVALVTGGSRGIGLMISEAFVAAGVRVYLNGRDPDRCAEAANRLAATGECIAAPGVLTDAEQFERVVAGIAERETALHLLVNNAGTSWGASLEDFPPAVFDATFAINVRAAFELTQALLPQLRAAARSDDPARVINVGSAAGLTTPPKGMGNFAYAASKSALHALTRHLAVELASDPITVNTLAPGLFPTRMTRFLLDDPALSETAHAMIPMGRAGVPEDIAGPVLFLASPAARYVTGAVLTVDGGMSL
jgi:NAD(P)-dependent dehydrogenase (short-subunit alcohol dehydrogenase family)